MPELPEVETTRRGLAPHVVNAKISRLRIRQRQLRWPVAPQLNRNIAGQRIVSLERRGKYLLFRLERGTVMIHLGMSGSLRYLPEIEPPLKHDHFDIELDNGSLLRFNDPRRFGSLHYTTRPDSHALLRNLGPEPLGEAFTVDYLHDQCRGRRTAIKQLIMNGNVVVGVGNIYASEALFRAGIHPTRPARRISRQRLGLLRDAIRQVLEDALQAGGTTLRDFVGSDGRPGYFHQSLAVYEREGQSCKRCGTTIRRRVIGQRATYFCPACQR